MTSMEGDCITGTKGPTLCAEENVGVSKDYRIEEVTFLVI